MQLHIMRIKNKGKWIGVKCDKCEMIVPSKTRTDAQMNHGFSFLYLEKDSSTGHDYCPKCIQGIKTVAIKSPFDPNSKEILLEKINQD